MEQSNNAERHGSVVCLKIKMGEQAYYIPVDKIENVRINPELVRVPEAPDGIAGLLLGDRGLSRTLSWKNARAAKTSQTGNAVWRSKTVTTAY